MSLKLHPPPGHHRRRPTLVSTLAVAAALVLVVGCRAPAGPSQAAAAPRSGAAAPLVTAHPTAARPRATNSSAHAPEQPEQPPGGGRTARSRADGRLPDGATAFDDAYPGVANLDPALLRALREATTEAARDGVSITVNSGWRSVAYQERLLDEAVARYGSRAEAARWVATPRTSPHVSGDAVDIGDGAATAWLAGHGARFGLCRVFGNEPWHVELRPAAVGHGCPTPYADPTHDPRMRS